jgi:hypothetical protein
MLIQIFLPGDSLDKPSIVQEVPFDETTFQANKDLWRAFEGLDPEYAAGPGFLRSETPVVVAPLVIPRPGLIKVRIVRRDVLVRAGTLVVQRASETGIQTAEKQSK